MSYLQTLKTAMDLSPDAVFFVRDQRGSYRLANQGLAGICCVSNPEDLIGRSNREFFEPAYADWADGLDAAVRAGDTIVNRFDNLRDAKGRGLWTLYSRACVDLPGAPRQVLSVSRRLPAGVAAERSYARLQRATDILSTELGEIRSVRQLAERCDCSASQLERDFARVLATTPRRYEATARAQRAKDMLRRKSPLLETALECGFSEQSSFSRFFRRMTGLTPGAYRAAASQSSLQQPL